MENLPAQTVPAAQGPQSGQKVAFLGDSITEYGAGGRLGYVCLVEQAFQQVGRPIVVIKAGVSGDTSAMMLARLKRDVLDQKPDWMTLSCGVNDVWGRSPGGGVFVEQFKKNVTAIVDQATAAGIKVVLLTPNRIGEVLPRVAGVPTIEKADQFSPYNDFLHAFAKERNLPVADIRAAEDAKLLELTLRWPHSPFGQYLTVDGTHMNPSGNQMMAVAVLRAMAFTDAQMAQVQAGWLDIADNVTYPATVNLSLRQLDRLNDLAESKGQKLDDMLGQAFSQSLLALAKQPLPPAKPK